MHGCNSFRLCRASSQAKNDGNLYLTQQTSVLHESEQETSTDTSIAVDVRRSVPSDCVQTNDSTRQIRPPPQTLAWTDGEQYLVQTVDPGNSDDGQPEYVITSRPIVRANQPKKTTHTKYSWPPMKIILPEGRSMTPEIFTQIDNRVCQLYTLFTNHYQFWLKARDDCKKVYMGSDYMFCMERKLQTLEKYLANIHVDIERCVTVFEVQTAVSAGEDLSYLSSWQKKNLTAVRHHLNELRKLQRDADPDSPYYAVRQQKIEELMQQESSIMHELLVPRLPIDSPGNDTRCLSVLLHDSVIPVKTAFIRKKISAINKIIRRSAANQLPSKDAAPVQY